MSDNSSVYLVNAQPVKAELSLAAPLSQAKAPIQLDVMIVCKKVEQDTRPTLTPACAVMAATNSARDKLLRLASVGLQLSENDRRVVIFSQFLAALGPVTNVETAVEALSSQQEKLEQLAIDLKLAEISAADSDFQADLPLFALANDPLLHH